MARGLEKAGATGYGHFICIARAAPKRQVALKALPADFSTDPDRELDLDSAVAEIREWINSTAH